MQGPPTKLNREYFSEYKRNHKKRWNGCPTFGSHKERLAFKTNPQSPGPIYTYKSEFDKPVKKQDVIPKQLAKTFAKLPKRPDSKPLGFGSQRKRFRLSTVTHPSQLNPAPIYNLPSDFDKTKNNKVPFNSSSSRTVMGLPSTKFLKDHDGIYPSLKKELLKEAAKKSPRRSPRTPRKIKRGTFSNPLFYTSPKSPSPSYPFNTTGSRLPKSETDVPPPIYNLENIHRMLSQSPRI
mmetsp:Transcript_7780/g.11541  ORF Transcript_7780/g.11541 Transcript_7780/m.11541 type:complete len:236 (-) Transcript_7780:45-752(-)